MLVFIRFVGKYGHKSTQLYHWTQESGVLTTNKIILTVSGGNRSCRLYEPCMDNADKKIVKRSKKFVLHKY